MNQNEGKQFEGKTISKIKFRKILRGTLSHSGIEEIGSIQNNFKCFLLADSESSKNSFFDRNNKAMIEV